MDLGLKGLRALVTGGSKGLGFAVAHQLAAEGCLVALNSRSQENLNEAAARIHQSTGQEAVVIPGDVTDGPEAAQEIITRAAGAMGGLDLLLTNAGGPPPGKFEDFDDAAWDIAIELSLLSHVRLIRAALPYLRQSDHPSVLAVTSISAKQPLPNLVLSNSVRMATLGLIKTLALELGHEGLRFNAILPGWTRTERVQTLMSHRARQADSTIDAEIAKQAKESPFGRMAEPEEFARPAVFLLSPAASYLTGVMLPVDGGSYKATL